MVESARSIHAMNVRRRMLLQLVFALVIFLSGMVIGTGGTVQWLKHRGGRIGPPPDWRGGPEPNEVAQRWMEDFGLTAEQAEEIKQVMTKVSDIRREAFLQSREQMEVAFTLMVDGIKAVMTDEQFEKWHAEFEKRQKQRGSRDRGGRDGRRGSGNRGGGVRRDRDPNRVRPEGEGLRGGGRDPNRVRLEGEGPRRDRDPNRPRQWGPRPTG